MTALLNIQGAPGTGKTTKLMELYIKYCEMIGPERVMCCTFTRAAADELRERCAAALGITGPAWTLRRRLPFVGTIHSLCLKLADINPKDIVNNEKLKEFDKRVGDGFKLPNIEYMDTWAYDEPTIKSEEVEAGLWMRAAALHRMVDIEETWELLDPDVASRLSFPSVRRLVENYEKWKEARHYVDFEDLLLLGRDLQPPVRVVLADECQDNSPLLWSVINSWGRLDTTASFVCAGDAYQCQPMGTQVLTRKGYKSIEDLDPTVDRLVSYDRSAGYLVGKQSGFSFEIQQHEINDYIYTIQAGGKETKTTGNHRWPFRWNGRAHDAKTTAVYLMRKGNRWRVGWCQLFNKQSTFHLGQRTRLEKADAAWILKVFDNKTDASIYESFISVRFGVPTIPFRAVDGATHITDDSIDRLFGMLDLETLQASAEACLWEHGRDHRYPIWSVEFPYVRIGMKTAGETVAYNLMSEIMSVLVPNEALRTARFEPLTVSRRRESAVVYSLNVEPHHLYIADGIITHNSLYSFAGGDPKLFSGRDGHWHVIRQSHRFNNQSAQYARAILVPAFGRDERFEQLTDWEGVGPNEGPNDPSEFWLARTNSLVGIKAAELQESGTPYVAIRGRAPLQTKAADAYRALARLEQGSLISKDDLAAIATIDRMPHAKRAQSFIKTLPQGYYTAASLEAAFGVPLAAIRASLPYVSYFTRIRARHGDDALFKRPALALGTVHAAKGKEAGSVTVCSSWATKPYGNLASTEGRRAEGCCAYVAASRHKHTLKIENLPGARGGRYPWPMR